MNTAGSDFEHFLPPERTHYWKRLGKAVLTGLDFLGESLNMACYLNYGPAAAVQTPAERHDEDLRAMRRELDNIISERTPLPDYIPKAFFKHL